MNAVQSVASAATATPVQSPVERARALQPLLAEYADLAESEGRIAAPVFEAMKAAGLFRIAVAKRAGGEGADMRTFVETVAEIGRTCPGSAWAYGIATGATGMAASLPEAQRRLLFPRGDELSCFVGVKSGTARATEGGFLVSGQWAYASGSLHCDWALCGVMIQDESGAQIDSGNAFIDLRGPDAGIVLDWNVAGLSGSGSNRVTADSQFVPDALVLRDRDMGDMVGFVGAAVAEPRDRWPMEPQFPLTVLPSMLGAAAGLCEAVRAKMNQRPIASWHYDRQTDSQQLLAMLGEAAIKIDSAWMHVYRACDVVDEGAAGRVLTPLDKVKAQADCGYAMRLLREAADMLVNVAGPGAFVRTNSIQRFWRDLSVGTRHNALNSALSLELLGRSLTGGASNIRNMKEI